MGRPQKTGDDSRGSTCAPSDDSQRVRILAESLVELQQKERSRLAFDLHDGPAQSVATGLFQVRLLKNAEGDELREGLLEVEQHLLTALEQLYGCMEQLRSRAMDHEDLAQKLEALSTEFAGRTGIPVTFSAEDCACQLSDSLQIAVFQIVHEALQNIDRHAQATTVDISVRIDPDFVEASITDDGKGFDPAKHPRDEGRFGYGLVGMRERARLLGGECDVATGPLGGCRVHAKIPVWTG